MPPSPPHEIAPVFIYQPRFCAPAWRPCRFPHGLTIHPSPIAARWGRGRAGAHASVALGLPVGAGVCGRANCRSYSPACTHTVRAGPGGGVMGGWAPARATPSAFAIATKQTPTPVAFPNAHFQHQGGWMDGWMHSCTDARLHAWLDRWMLGRSIIHPSFLLPNLADG